MWYLLTGYKTHTDCVEDNEDQRDRMATILVYLQDVAEGGETEFPGKIWFILKIAFEIWVPEKTTDLQQANWQTVSTEHPWYNRKNLDLESKESLL